MAHFAKIGLNNKVMTVNSVNDDKLLNADGIEDEEVGRQFLENLSGWPIWKKCSYNTRGGIHILGGTPFRANFPAIGDTYDEDLDIFYSKKPHNSWTLDETKGVWNAPVTAPTLSEREYTESDVTKHYIIVWNESLQRWDACLATSIDIVKYWNPTSSTWVDV